MRRLRVLFTLIVVGLLGYGLIAGDDGIWLIVVFASVPFVIYLVWAQLVHGEAGFQRNLQKLASVLLVGFILVSVHLARQQVVVARQVQDKVVTTASGGIVRDPRLVDAQLKVERGRIYDAKGNLVAGREVSPDGYVKRTYLNPTMGYIIGYYSPTMYGNSNLEKVYDDYLSGERGGNPFAVLEDKLLHRVPEGNDLYLTLDPELQQVAQDALGDRQGAVVLMDTSSGAIRALVSNPRYDPTALAFDPNADWSAESQRIVTNWQSLLDDPAKPLLTRPTLGLYPPGSTFKTVTAAGGIDTGVITSTAVFTDTGELEVEGHKVLDLNRPDPKVTRFSVGEAYMYSLNVVFAQMGLLLGPDRLTEYAHRFGFDRPLEFDLPVAQSQIASDPSFLKGKTALADTSYGQGQLLATPLQMALVAAGVANKGEVPKPYLVSQVRSPNGDIIRETKREVIDRAISAETAAKLKDMMVEAVDKWLTGGKIPGVKVAGKTGTAQLEDGESHAWFIAFAPADNPTYAIAVVVERGGQGNSVAAPIARTVLSAALTGN